MIALLAATIRAVVCVDADGMSDARVSNAARFLAYGINAALCQRAVPVACATH